MSEFQLHIEGYTHFSSPGNRFRLWGKDVESYGFVRDVNPIAISFHYPQRWATFCPGNGNNPASPALEALVEIADRVGVPVLWFGEYNVDYRGFVNSSQSEKAARVDEVEFGQITRTPDGEGAFELDRAVISLEDIEGVVQATLGTDCEGIGSAKSENKRTNPFAYFSRNCLPEKYTIQDIDGLHAVDPDSPVSIMEIKRAEMSAGSWTPYKRDLKQYYLLVDIAEKAGLDCYVLKHQKQRLQDLDGEFDDVRLYDDLSRPDLESQPSYIGSHKEVEEVLGDSGEKIPVDEALTRIFPDDEFSNSTRTDSQ